MARIFSHTRNYFRWYLLLSLFFISIFLFYISLVEDKNGFLTISFLDVGQGDAIFIESPTGIQVVIDGGPNRFLMKEISEVIPWYDKNIDMIIITHPDRDHYEGFIPLLDRYKIGVTLDPGIPSDSEPYLILENKISEKEIPRIVARRGQTINIGGGAYIEILFPDRDVSGLNSNDGSIISRLVYGDISVLLTGDSPQNIENYLVSLDGFNLDSDILKVGHHGSRTSTGRLFASAVSPIYAIISAEKNSRYGHPHPEVLEVLESLEVEILGTYDLGRITFVTDGKEITRK